MNNNTWYLVIGAIIVVGGASYFFTKSDDTSVDTLNVTPQVLPENNTAITPQAENNAVTTPATPDATTPAPDVVSITVENEGMKFLPSTLTVKKGQTVRLTFKNSGGFHDWKIDEFNAATKQMPAGTEETIEFVADKAGSFEYYCSVGKHREMGMKGTLTVTE